MLSDLIVKIAPFRRERRELFINDSFLFSGEDAELCTLCVKTRFLCFRLAVLLTQAVNLRLQFVKAVLQFCQGFDPCLCFRKLFLGRRFALRSLSRF